MSKGYLSAAALIIAGVSAPAMAVITPFATFSPVGTAANMKLIKSISGSVTTYKIGTQASASVNNALFGSAPVSFTYLQSALGGGFTSVKASFTFLATSVGVPFMDSNIDKLPGFTGTFSFISTEAFTDAYGTTYGVGTNLISSQLAFDGALFSGKNGGTTGALNDSTLSGSTINFSSDVLNFSQTVQRDFSLSFSSISPSLSETGTGANTTIRAFRTTGGGLFSSDPAPLVNGVPEPASWMMMMVGFGAVGSMIRTSRRQRAVASVA